MSVRIFDSPRVLDEEPISLTEACRAFPRKCSRSTLERWIREGTRGVRLESAVMGNQRFTSKKAIKRFLLAQQNQGEESCVEVRSSMTPKEINEKSKKYDLPTQE